VLRDCQRQRFKYATVMIGEIDLEVVDGSGQHL
jgi:hypothetical protein